MVKNDIIEILKSVGAVMTGDHFVYTSGKHGEVYVNKDALYPDSQKVNLVAGIFAEKYKNHDIDTVASPALGGIILSTWVSYHLSILKGKVIYGVYAEKMPDKTMAFTRGYDKYIKDKKVLVIEDLTTTGGSVKKVVDLVRNSGGVVSEVCVMINRDPENVNEQAIGAPFSSLGVIKAEAWDEEDLPEYIKKRKINTTVGHGQKYLNNKNRI